MALAQDMSRFGLVVMVRKDEKGEPLQKQDKATLKEQLVHLFFTIMLTKNLELPNAHGGRATMLQALMAYAATKHTNNKIIIQAAKVLYDCSHFPQLSAEIDEMLTNNKPAKFTALAGRLNKIPKVCGNCTGKNVCHQHYFDMPLDNTGKPYNALARLGNINSTTLLQIINMRIKSFLWHFAVIPAVEKSKILVIEPKNNYKYAIQEGQYEYMAALAEEKEYADEYFRAVLNLYNLINNI